MVSCTDECNVTRHALNTAKINHSPNSSYYRIYTLYTSIRVNESQMEVLGVLWPTIAV